MNPTRNEIDAYARAAGQIGESQCTVVLHGVPVTIHVPDRHRYETAAGSQRLAQLGILASKPVTPTASLN